MPFGLYLLNNVLNFLALNSLEHPVLLYLNDSNIVSHFTAHIKRALVLYHTSDVGADGLTLCSTAQADMLGSIRI